MKEECDKLDKEYQKQMKKCEAEYKDVVKQEQKCKKEADEFEKLSHPTHMVGTID